MLIQILQESKQKPIISINNDQDLSKIYQTINPQIQDVQLSPNTEIWGKKYTKTQLNQIS